jgi:hypothetical protein
MYGVKLGCFNYFSLNFYKVTIDNWQLQPNAVFKRNATISFDYTY